MCTPPIPKEIQRHATNYNMLYTCMAFQKQLFNISSMHILTFPIWLKSFTLFLDMCGVEGKRRTL